MSEPAGPDLLLYGDTEQSAALRHEVPLVIIDAFLYAEVDGQAYVMVSDLERRRVAAVRPDAQLLDIGELGLRELRMNGLRPVEISLELASRAAARAGVREAVVDFEFPLGLADRLRDDGIRLTVADDEVKYRRRVKTADELAGIRRAQRAAEAGMAAAASLLRRAQAHDGALVVGGEALTAEQVRAALRQACEREGAPAPPDVIVASVWQGTGHDPGAGPLPAGLPIQVDLWPRDEAAGTWADMTRTFVCAGDAPPEIRRQEQLVRRALEDVRAQVRPGVTGSALHGICCDIFEEAGYATQRSGRGADPSEGFQFSLGHGVGLRVHEDPAVGIDGHAPLIAGDVIAVEPGLWDAAQGGVRYEDLLLVTDTGCETLTRYPYDLAP